MDKLEYNLQFFLNYIDNYSIIMYVWYITNLLVVLNKLHVK